MPHEPPRVLLVVDHPERVFHRIARRLLGFLHDHQFAVITAAKLQQNTEADLCVVFWWPSVHHIQAVVHAERTILCVYDGHSWTDEQGREKLQLAMHVSHLVVVPCEAIAVALARSGLRCPPICICEDGVDLELFPEQPHPKGFTVGWVGNPGYAVRGVGLLEDACRQAGVPLIGCDGLHGYVAHEKMAAQYYQRINVLLCASGYDDPDRHAARTGEGTPNPLLEALACGRPVITTDVGLARRIVMDGLNGYVVPRDVGAFVHALWAMQRADLRRMAHHARIAAEAHAWRYKLPAWRAAIRAALEA